MDLKLINYVASLNEMTQFEATTPLTPKFVKRTNSVLGKTTLIVVSHLEPHDTPLPINVIWAVFDKASAMYKKIYKRVSKDPNPSMGTQHTWVMLNHFDQLWETQTYAAGDEPSADGSVPAATVTVRGIVRLSQDAEDPDFPVVVAAEDLRNTNARYPLEHDEMHPEIALRRVKTRGRDVQMDEGGEADNFTPIIQPDGHSTYVLLKGSEICENFTPFTTASDPSSLTIAPVVGELVIPELTLNEFINGVGAASNKQVSFVIRAYGAVNPDTGFRRFLGYFNPVAVNRIVNGSPVALPSNTFMVSEEGTHEFAATLHDVANSNTITVFGAIVGI